MRCGSLKEVSDVVDEFQALAAVPVTFVSASYFLALCLGRAMDSRNGSQGAMDSALTADQ